MSRNYPTHCDNPLCNEGVCKSTVLAWRRYPCAECGDIVRARKKREVKIKNFAKNFDVNVF